MKRDTLVKLSRVEGRASLPSGLFVAHLVGPANAPQASADPLGEMHRCSFEFLLAREPKESILSQFDLPVIARYFPEYEREIKKHLGT